MTIEKFDEKKMLLKLDGYSWAVVKRGRELQKEIGEDNFYYEQFADGYIFNKEYLEKVKEIFPEAVV